MWNTSCLSIVLIVLSSRNGENSFFVLTLFSDNNEFSKMTKKKSLAKRQHFIKIFYPLLGFPLVFLEFRVWADNDHFLFTYRTAKYTMWSFFPRYLYLQFSKGANIFFLFITILQVIFLNMWLDYTCFKKGEYKKLV